MSNLLEILQSGDPASGVFRQDTVLLVLLLAFLIGQAIAWVYMGTHLGVSYSRSFVSSLVVVPPVVSLVMMLMSGSLVAAFGLLAVFAVVRFRNVLKDTRDAVFILWAIAMGMAVGTMRFGTAVLGCICLSAIMVYLRVTVFGSRHRYDAVLSLHVDGGDPRTVQVRPVLRRHCSRTQLTSQREDPAGGVDVSYMLLLRNPQRSRELLSELQTIDGVTDASLHLHEDETEV